MQWYSSVLYRQPGELLTEYTHLHTPAVFVYEVCEIYFLLSYQKTALKWQKSSHWRLDKVWNPAHFSQMSGKGWQVSLVCAFSVILCHDGLSVLVDKTPDCYAVYTGFLMLLHDVFAETEVLCARQCVCPSVSTRESVRRQAGQLAGPVGPGQAKYNSIPVSWSSPIPRTLCSPRGENE